MLEGGLCGLVTNGVNNGAIYKFVNGHMETGVKLFHHSLIPMKKGEFQL